MTKSVLAESKAESALVLATAGDRLFCLKTMVRFDPNQTMSNRYFLVRDHDKALPWSESKRTLEYICLLLTFIFSETRHNCYVHGNKANAAVDSQDASFT